MIGHGGRIGAAASAACLVAALSGCASVPTGGPTFPGRGDNAGGQADTFTRLIPAGPQPGVGEGALVRGFLKDMGSFEENHKAARLYMTEDEQAVWKPSDQVLVYGEMDAVRFDVEAVEEDRTARVRMRTPLYATIRTDGQYVPADQGENIDIAFDLTKVDGEWRIADLPDDLLLSRRDVDRVYRPLNLYYFNRDLSTLVPDPVFLPVQPTTDITEQLARALIRMLVDGPTDWLAPAVRSSFPEGVDTAVSYESGMITVELGAGADGTGTEERFGMGAQLVWTLKQLPEVQELTLRIGGEDVEFAGAEGGSLQTSSQEWNAVNPSGVDGGSLRSYFMRDGQLWSLDADQQESLVEGAPGEGTTLLERHAVSLDEDRVAGVVPDDGSVRVAELVDGSEYATVLADGEYTSLSWDVYGNLWVLQDLSGEADDAEEDEDLADDTERGDAASSDSERQGEPGDPATRLWLLPGGSDPVEVTAPELADAAVTELRVSRDGTRVAVLTGTGETGAVSVGRVVYGESAVTLQGFLPLAADLTSVDGLSWRGADQLAVLGQKDRGALQAYLVPLNGSGESTSAGAVTGSDMKTIAAGPGLPLLSGTEEDTISMSSDRLMWRRVADGTNPVYPG
ncbi:LpqB family beta-propeller domain-containing protein [Actinorugispora endophytica]|uniref:Lipoprotein LpqB n=1 Tax=Actinorugispora endophytica TaxID=1605990 RepID=A0A4R6UX66_9ACTN|nr:LpqB family beta-propeller domain-containing protein [Actinorugispora endophytica]TDQ51962.1 sporulation and spore germination protein [Actinorugispora endophytica]